MNHTNTILKIFQTGNKYTVAELNEMLNFKCNHPLTVISELRKRGHNILDQWVSCKNGRYKKYWIGVEND